MSRIFPDAPAGPFEPPPRHFEDAEGRPIAIEALGEGDEEALVSMYLDFDPADRAQGIPPTGEERIRDWLVGIASEECVNVVARSDGRAVGHATLVPDGTEGYELAIFVLGEYQNAGIGTRLITALLGQGEREGVDRVWLTVERWNAPAIALYRKVGFESSKSESFEIEMSLRLDPE
ncbi:GNAT family N-acetyltransferase [Halomarina ordinaria]|uniref:GNAT family N-acetyltransferase n=1 Tax=Halomarina ordinaria TaxID=3033939 RepID=A0ABD5UC71_9EURY|nr:GNAT family N-acetyltransferase [Halomarina sp. PSRA2]